MRIAGAFESVGPRSTGKIITCSFSVESEVRNGGDCNICGPSVAMLVSSESAVVLIIQEKMPLMSLAPKTSRHWAICDCY